MASFLPPYGQSLALLTDLYELTMACGYWKLGMADREAVFHLFFRKHPFGGGFTIAAGLGPAVEYLRAFRFDSTDIDYLAGLKAPDGAALFDSEFLEYLGALELSCDIDAVPEGTVVFPHEPLLRIRGPLLQCQILETALLNIINFQTLIATKSARVALAARGDDVLEFGLRRAQGIDGGLAASRAAYLGGCAATSNVLAGKVFGIPVRGTHAHSWVMSFESEAEAFDAWARSMPRQSVFLVDTYNTVEGVRRAVEAGRRLRELGYPMAGVRLDSGDLGALSVEARRILDESGFHDAKIVASGDLDEHALLRLKAQGAPIAVWGVGTRLVTAFDEPALGGVYKIGAIRDENGQWRETLKTSDDPEKASIPGLQQVRRYVVDGRAVADLIYDEPAGVCGPPTGVPFSPDSDSIRPPVDAESHDLLQPVFRRGRLVAEPATLEQARARVRAQLALLGPRAADLNSPVSYSVGLEIQLDRRRRDLAGRSQE